MKCRLIRHPGQASHSDEVLARFGAATELPLREQVANALVNKGGTLDALDQSEDAIAVYDDVLARFGAATELPLREQVSRAQLNKASMQNSCKFPVDTVFKRNRKRSPTTRTRAVLIADMMMLERKAGLKPAR